MSPLSATIVAALLTAALAGDCRSCADTAHAAVNAHRASRGMPALAFSPGFHARCAAHNRAMAGRGSLYHTSLGGGVYAENVAMRSSGGDAAAGLVAQWIGSPKHETNMVGNYACGATAVYDDGHKVYGTQMFGACNDGGAVAPAAPPVPKTYPPEVVTEAPWHAPKGWYYRTEAPATEAPKTAPPHKYADGHGMCRVMGERCMGASGYEAVVWKPCCGGLVCVDVFSTCLGYGKHCVPPRWEGDHNEEYGKVHTPPYGYEGFDCDKAITTAPPTVESGVDWHYVTEAPATEAPVTEAPVKHHRGYHYHAHAETAAPATQAPTRAPGYYHQKYPGYKSSHGKPMPHLPSATHH